MRPDALAEGSDGLRADFERISDVPGRARLGGRSCGSAPSMGQGQRSVCGATTQPRGLPPGRTCQPPALPLLLPHQPKPPMRTTTGAFSPLSGGTAAAARRRTGAPHRRGKRPRQRRCLGPRPGRRCATAPRCAGVRQPDATAPHAAGRKSGQADPEPDRAGFRAIRSPVTCGALAPRVHAAASHRLSGVSLPCPHAPHGPGRRAGWSRVLSVTGLSEGGRARPRSLPHREAASGAGRVSRRS